MKVYAVNIKDITEDKLKSLIKKVPKDKQIKINKLIFKADKLRTLISEILLRIILYKEFHIKDKNIVISKNEYGKPYLESYKDVEFNISHSGDFVICAIDNKPIGVDIEEINDINYKEIAENFFSKKDVDFILKDNDEKFLERFYEIWTLKESYIKAKGMGLSIPLNSFSFNINNNCISLDEDDKVYNFKHFNMIGGYKVSVCSLNGEIADNIIEVNQTHLIDEYCKLQ